MAPAAAVALAVSLLRWILLTAASAVVFEATVGVYRWLTGTGAVSEEDFAQLRAEIERLKAERAAPAPSIEAAEAALAHIASQPAYSRQKGSQ